MRHRHDPRISRRRVLQGLGVGAAVAPFLPLLESAAGGPEAPPKRFIVFYHPHGTYRPNWLPTGTETDFQLSPILQPLSDFKQKLVVVDGLDVMAAGPPGGPHMVGAAYVFTGSPMMDEPLFEHATSGGPHGWASHASIDQVIAQHIGKETAFPSLEFGVQTGAPFPGARISYAGPALPLAPQPDPHFMFNRLFGEQGLDTAALEALESRRLRVIDVVKPQLDAVQQQVNQADRIKIEAHLQSIVELEDRLKADYDCAPPDIGEPVSLGDNDNTGIISRQQLDLMAEALACQATNVASIMYRQAENDNRPYPFAGLDPGILHHENSHAGDSDQAAWDALTQIYTWYAGELAYLAGKLDAIVEPDGSTVLDNTIILWGTEIAKGNTHQWTQMPFVLVGGGQGSIHTDRFLQFSGNNHCQLLVALCQAMGLDLDEFGGFDDGSGALPGLLT